MSEPSMMLEPLRLRHLPALHALGTDPEVARLARPFAAPDASPFPACDACRFAIVVDGVGPVGLCGFHIAPSRRVGVLHYWVGRPYQRLGLATRAARQVVEFAFTRYRLDEVQAIALRHNVASLRVLERLGFVERGQLCIEGARIVCLSLTRSSEGELRWR